jgi:type IV pilus assembly protein PilW
MRMQENGEFAMQAIRIDASNSGFWGCASTLGNITNNLNPAGSGYNSTTMGFTTSLAGTAVMTGNGQDTITLNGASVIDSGAWLIAPYPTTTGSALQIAATNSVSAGMIALVSDCLHGDIFQITNGTATTGNLQHTAVAGSPGNLTANLSKMYGAGSFVFSTFSHTYSLAADPVSGLTSLYRADSGGAVELVEGIESLVILYGEDLDGDGTANRYVRANNVTNMDNVVSIRINLVAISPENNLVPTPTAYVFNNQTITPTDRRMRRVYTATVVLRNRVQ